MNLAAEGIVVLDPDGAITFANRAFAEMLRLPQSEIMGQSFVEFLQGESHAAVGANAQVDGPGCTGGERMEQKVQKSETNGFRAIAAIRAREADPGEYFRIITIKAHTVPGGRNRCVMAPASGSLARTIPRKDLHAALAFAWRHAGEAVAAPSRTGGTRIVDYRAALEIAGEIANGFATCARSS